MQSNAQLAIAGQPPLTSAIAASRATRHGNRGVQSAKNELRLPTLRSEGWETLAWWMIALAAGAVLVMSLTLGG